MFVGISPPSDQLSSENDVTVVRVKMSVAPHFNCFSFDALTQLNPKESSNKTRSLGNSLPLKEDDVYVKDCFKIPPPTPASSGFKLPLCRIQGSTDQSRNGLVYYELYSCYGTTPPPPTKKMS